MGRIMPMRRNARAFTARFPKSLASLRQRPGQAKLRSTIQRFGNGSKPVRSLRLTISSRQRPVLATAAAVAAPWYAPSTKHVLGPDPGDHLDEREQPACSTQKRDRPVPVHNSETPLCT
jgi:hypothetical protein